MINQFIFEQDIGGNTGVYLNITDLNYNATLATSTDTSFTIPGENTKSTTGSRYDYAALIQTTDGHDLWVALNTAAAVPAGSSFAATKSMLINSNVPKIFLVKYGDVLHFFTATASKSVGISLYLL